jgi:O-antigen/teichoic acid export membrane protein
MGYGFYVIVNNVGEKIITATDAIVAGIFLPIQSITYLAIAGNLVGYLRAVLGTTAQIFNPLASELHTLRESSRLSSAFLLGVKICTIITAPIAASFVVLGEQFVALWMGGEFAAPSSGVLTILALAAFFSAPQYVFSSVLYGMSQHRIMALLRIAEAAANLLLSIVLVQSWGLIGIALGTAIPSAIAVMLVLPVVAGRIVGVGLVEFYEQAYVRPLLAIAPFVAGAWWIRSSYPADDLLGFFLRIGALLLLYPPCAFALVLDATERKLVLSRWRRAPKPS